MFCSSSGKEITTRMRFDTRLVARALRGGRTLLEILFEASAEVGESITGHCGLELQIVEARPRSDKG